MSKETYSETISNKMYSKIKAIEYLDPYTFFNQDDDFYLMLCLAYMTLSKEMIIKKEMKNRDRMGRLTQYVDDTEIDKLFDPNFAPEMPVITHARENNNLWILDNIRDSIMHGQFDIDEEAKVFLINNDQFDRELIATVPFSWFIAYAKNDILSKKMLESYSVRGFYYNKTQYHRAHLKPEEEFMKNIMYNVYISGDKFNVSEIENRIRTLFDVFAYEEINDLQMKKYRKKLNSDKFNYDKKYLASFYNASEKVKERIEMEFPGVNVKIFINNRKHKLAMKAARSLPPYLRSYDFMIHKFNKIVSSKGNNLLKCLSNIIDHMGTLKDIDYSKVNTTEAMRVFNLLLNGNTAQYDEFVQSEIYCQDTIKQLRTLIINVYGLSTLVINQENIYNKHYLNYHPSNCRVQGHARKYFTEFAEENRKLMKKLLDTEIKLFEKKEQLENCKKESAKEKIKIIVEDLENQKAALDVEVHNLIYTMDFEAIIKDKELFETFQTCGFLSVKKYTEFKNASTSEEKEKIKKEIMTLLDEQKEIGSKCIFGKCHNMTDIFEILRNSLSHIGRIYIGKDKALDTILVLNDYDSKNEKTGEVITTYRDLIYLLSNPYQKTIGPALIKDNFE